MLAMSNSLVSKSMLLSVSSECSRTRCITDAYFKPVVIQYAEVIKGGENINENLLIYIICQETKRGPTSQASNNSFDERPLSLIEFKANV